MQITHGIDLERAHQATTRVDSDGSDEPLPVQVDFWTAWNGAYLDRSRSEISLRQADIVIGWLQALGRNDLDLMEVGCGAGWLAERMLPFGRVAATDLAEAVLAVARERSPQVDFIAGDFMQLPWPARSVDVVISLEVLAHVPDQVAFIARMAELLRPGGVLMLSTQNRFVLERSADVLPRGVGQIRHWVSRHELAALLAPHFRLDTLFSICPHGHLGALRLVNSPKLNRLLAVAFGAARLERLKERWWLGHTLMVRATRR